MIYIHVIFSPPKWFDHDRYSNSRQINLYASESAQFIIDKACLLLRLLPFQYNNGVQPSALVHFHFLSGESLPPPCQTSLFAAVYNSFCCLQLALHTSHDLILCNWLHIGLSLFTMFVISVKAVSYTHLDGYKRQLKHWLYMPRAYCMLRVGSRNFLQHLLIFHRTYSQSQLLLAEERDFFYGRGMFPLSPPPSLTGCVGRVYPHYLLWWWRPL